MTALEFSLTGLRNTEKNRQPRRIGLQERLGCPNFAHMSTRRSSTPDLSLKQQAYVEAIAQEENRHGHAHVSLLARELGVSKPSVVQMLGRLVELGIVRRKNSEAMLTGTGRRLAGELSGRHSLLFEFMVNELGMDRKTADADACRIEHVVSPAFVRSLRHLHKKLMRGQG